MKICSLLPSSTEILYALDLGDQIAAVTHECDFPEEAASKPRITESIIDHNRLSSLEIDHHVSSNIGRHGSIYRLKEDLLEALKPDLIITQELCDVCAVSYKDVQRAARVLEGKSRIVSLEPNTLNDVLDTILLVGDLTGRQQAAEKKVHELRQRLDRVRERVAGRSRPAVFAMEWLDPPFSGGHWVPEMVEIAGGYEVLGKTGLKSERIAPERIVAAKPEIVVLMPCGFSLDRTVEEYHRTKFFAGWEDLPAVRNNRVYAVDGSSYFNRSGPRLIDGVEILAEIFHPRGADVAYRHIKRLS
ncbi:MAG TPA: cobalamin-binding protein [Terriglobia bacterium]|nr:cobalamin-binding protein [Terriglobia bacterium]